MKRTYLLLGTIASILIIIGCSKNLEKQKSQRVQLNLPDDPHDYEATSAEMGTLGRVLFYDKSLSVNNAIACGSCHKQVFAFSDNKQFSSGFENRETGRNTPPIQNLMGAHQGIFGEPGPIAFSKSTGMEGIALFWDGRKRLLKNMVLDPVLDHVEMGLRHSEDILEKVGERPYYPQLFEAAFGTEEVTLERIAEALSGFTASITSFQSQFDQSRGSLENLGALEQKGLGLFNGKYDCGSCHNLNSSVGYAELRGEELVNIGLEGEYTDKGLGARTGNDNDNGKFKIPNLRNVALTAPYMHDGRFGSLEQVMEHYSTGIQNHPNLDDRLEDDLGNPKVMDIPEADKEALIAFLHTLTDNNLITDPRYSDPFVAQ